MSQDFFLVFFECKYCKIRKALLKDSSAAYFTVFALKKDQKKIL